uniref:capsid/nuclear shuttle family protein n=1 Tax=Aliarcobacter sp. TaxID=2321116 RepID=UPI0040489AF4
MFKRRRPYLVAPRPQRKFRRANQGMQVALPARRGRRDSFALRNMRTGGLLGIETKFLDTSYDPAALAAGTDCSAGEHPPNQGCVGCLTAPAQGDSSSERDGNKIVVKSILLQGTINIAAQAAQSTADVAPTIMVCLVQDTQTNGAQLASENVFTNPSANATLAPSPNRNMSYTARFKVLKMRKFQMPILPMTNDTGETGGVIQSGYTKHFKLSWKGLMPVTFTTGSTTADIANVTNNSVQVVAFCSSTGAAPQMGYNCRIRFVG